MVAQMFQMVSFATILDHIGPFREVGAIYPHLEINVPLPAQLRVHSKWLSIRNSFGITPKGPMGPSPQGRRRRPWVPLVSLGSPPLGPPKGIGTLQKRQRGVLKVW